MRVSKVIGLLLIGLGAIGLISFFFSSDEDRDSWFGLRGKEINTTKSADAGPFARLKIDVDSAQVRLIRSDSAANNVTATLSGRTGIANEAVGLRWTENGDELAIGLDQSGMRGIRSMFSSLTLVVELPEKNWHAIDVATGSGDIEVKRTNATDLTLTAGSGDIDAEEIQADSIRLKVGSGDIEVEEFIGNELNFQTGSGNVKLSDGAAALAGKTGSGNIRIEVDELLYDADLQTGSGNVKVYTERQPMNLTVDFSGGSGSGRVKWEGFSESLRDKDTLQGTFGNGEHLLKVRTGSGGFSLEKD